VPGHNLDDIDPATGEPRRIVYHWPNVYIEPTASELRAEDPPAAGPPHTDNGAALGQRLRDDVSGNVLNMPADNGELRAAELSVVHDPSAVGVSATRGG